MSPDAKLAANRALAIAATLLAERFPEAQFAFVAGSIMRGQGTVGSDIDMVVLYPRLDRAWRESIVAEGMPVEAFVHDRDSLEDFFGRDVEAGRPVMITMVVEGRLAGNDISGARDLREKAKALLADGPAPLAGQRLQTMLYQISDHVDDLRGERSAAEFRAIAAQLYPKLADLMLLGRGHWSGAGKWLPRRLAAALPEASIRFEAAFDAAFADEPRDLITLCYEELERFGGPVFDGYRIEAPA